MKKQLLTSGLGQQLHPRIVTFEQAPGQKAQFVYGHSNLQAGVVAMDDLGEPVGSNADSISNFLYAAVGELGVGSMVHSKSMDSLSQKSSGKSIKRWMHQDTFRVQFKAWKKSMKIQGARITTRTAAQMFGTTVQTLNAYLYRPECLPSLPWLQSACRAMGCSCLPFIDDPGGVRQDPPVDRRQSQNRRVG